MGHKNKVKVYTFSGYSSLMETAIDNATAALNVWYGGQDALWFSDGHSLYQFSTSVFEHHYDDGERVYQYIITVFDTRREQ